MSKWRKFGLVMLFIFILRDFVLADVKVKESEVNYSDGMNAKEAITIVKKYFSPIGTKEVWQYYAEIENECWKVTCRIKNCYEDSLRCPIYYFWLDMKTGKIISRGGTE